CRLRLNLQRGTLVSANGRRTRSGDDPYMGAACPGNKHLFCNARMQKEVTCGPMPVLLSGPAIDIGCRRPCRIDLPDWRPSSGRSVGPGPRLGKHEIAKHLELGLVLH